MAEAGGGAGLDAADVGIVGTGTPLFGMGGAPLGFGGSMGGETRTGPAAGTATGVGSGRGAFSLKSSASTSE